MHSYQDPASWCVRWRDEDGKMVTDGWLTRPLPGMLFESPMQEDTHLDTDTPPAVFGSGMRVRIPITIRREADGRFTYTIRDGSST